MADSLDALKFDAIIDDKEFKASVDRITNEARRFNTDISNILTVKARIQTTQIVSKASATNAAEVARHLETIEQKMNNLSGKKLLVGDADALNETLQKVLEKMDSMEEKTKKSKDLFGEMNKELYKSKDFMGELARLTGITFGVAGIKTFLSSVVKVSGEFEVQRMALTSMLQDAGKADAIFKTLQKRALQSPYTFQDLTKYAKQLTAFNIDADQLVETEKRLADVAAGLGVDMGRIVLAYGQVKSAGVLKGTELRQFTEAGVPLLQSLADQIKETEGRAVSLSEVFRRISKKEIPFEMVEQAFRDMTSEGGKFYNMQEVLVDTLKGKIDKLRDAWQQALYKIGEANSGVLKNTVDWFIKIVTNIDKFSNLLGGLIVTFGSYIALLATCAAAQKVIFGIEYIANIGKVIKEIRAAKTAMEGFAMASNLVNVAAFALAALVGVGYAVYKSITKVDEATKRLNESMYAYEKAVDSEKKKLGELAAVLKDAEKGTDEWNKAKDEVVKSYGKYFKGLDDEITKVGNLETAYANLIKKVEESISMRKFADFYQQERSLYESQQDEFLADIQSKLEKRLGAYEGTLAFRSFRDALLGAPGDAYSVVSGFNKFGDDLGLVLTKATELDKAYATFWNNQQKAQERMGLGGRLFSPEALLKKLTADENPIVNPTWGGSTNDKVPKWLKERIDTIKDLQSAYKALKKDADDLTEDDIDKYLDMAFSWADASLVGRRDFWAMLNEAADEMEKFDKTAANDLRSDVSKGMAQEVADEWKEKKKQEKEAQKELKDSQKALERYAAAYAKFDKDWGTGATGVAGKTEKALRDYHNENRQIDADYLDAQMKAYEAHKDNVDAIKEETDKLELLYKKRRKANDAKLMDSIDGLADDIFKKLMEGFDLTDWGDKSLGQIKDIEQALKDIQLPPDVILLLKDYPILLARLDSALKNKANKKLENTVNPEKLKKIAKYASDAASMVREFSNSVNGIVSDSTRRQLRELTSGLSDIADMADTATKAYTKMSDAWNKSKAKDAGKGISGVFSSAATAGAAAAWVAAVVAINMKVLELAALEDEAQRRQNDAFREARSTGRLQDTEKGSIFGTSSTALMESRIKQIDRIRESMNKYKDEVEDFAVTTQHYDFWKKALGWMHPENWDGNKLLPDIRNSLSSVAEGLGMELYDQYNNLNATTLKAILESYEDLTYEERQWLEQAIADSEDYAEAISDVEDLLQGVFGDIASSAADKIVEQWKNMGNAALDYADILDDVATRYAKMLVESAILDKVLNKEEADRVAEMFINGRADDAMAAIADDMQKIAGMEPLFEQIMTTFDPYFNRENSLSDSNSLGSGIKSITEDTANLLASYINAIRDDVSNIRRLQETGWESINLLGASVPTLNEYLAQIAATNFDIAQSNQSILSEIQSVIGAPGTSGMVVRVEYA